MATFTKQLFWSVTTSLTLLGFLPEARAQTIGTRMINIRVHRPIMSTPHMTSPRMFSNMMNGSMMGPTMMNGATMSRNMMNGNMMAGNIMNGMLMGRQPMMMTPNMMGGIAMNGTMQTPLSSANGFGGFGTQGFGGLGGFGTRGLGLPWNSYSGSGLGGVGGYGGLYGSGGYGLDALNPNWYAPSNESSNSTSRRQRSRQEEPPTLTPEQERKRIHQMELDWSRGPLPDNQTTSATALNILLADLQSLQTRGIQGPEVNIDQAVLPSVNVVVDGRNGNIGVLKHDGRIHWPASLGGADFEAERRTIESSLSKVIDEAVAGEALDLHDLTGALARMRFRLAAQIQETPAPEYIRAKRLLDQLDDVVRLLRQPDAGNYFNQTYAAKGQTVAQLVQYMSLHGLRFAPAVEGDEPAYVALHQALAEYDLAANSQVVAKK